jgi:hypothetical protein
MLDAVLDGLNAYGFLDDVQARHDEKVLRYGPKIVTGESWVGVVIWQRPRGYHGYRTLTLLGIWAYVESVQVMITLGAKTLSFSNPYYNAEAYHKHIQTRFDLYYEGDASPPPESDRLYTVVYDSDQRLNIRREIEAQLVQWAKRYG